MNKKTVNQSLSLTSLVIQLTLYEQQWTPTHGRAKAGRPARTYIQQLCEDTGCCPEDLPEAMNNREKWRERVRDIRATSTTWWWWWHLIHKISYHFLSTSVCLSLSLSLSQSYFYTYTHTHEHRKKGQYSPLSLFSLSLSLSFSLINASLSPYWLFKLFLTSLNYFSFLSCFLPFHFIFIFPFFFIGEKKNARKWKWFMHYLSINYRCYWLTPMKWKSRKTRQILLGRLVDDFNDTSYTLKLGNRVHYTHMFTFFVLLS